MNHFPSFSYALRSVLIGALLLTCAFFYVRKWGSSTPPFSSPEASTLCASTPGCKSISTKWDYDVTQGRVVVIVRATLARKTANATALETIQQAIDRHYANEPWINRILWPAPRLESRYE